MQAIAHASDFKTSDQSAFHHALALALHYRCRLDLLHVHPRMASDNYDCFPHVRETLVRWGALERSATVADMHRATGISVRKVEIADDDAVSGLSRFLITHRPNLLVMASHGREGLSRLLAGSVSSDTAREVRIPTLFITPKARGFVDEGSGRLNIKRILVPVAIEPAPHRAIALLLDLFRTLSCKIDCVHVGDDALQLLDGNARVLPVRNLKGPVTEIILSEIESVRADVVAMMTAGQQGFLDFLQGSTTEQVVQRAACPVLTLHT